MFSNDGYEEAIKFSSKILNQVFLFSFIIIIISWFAIPYIVPYIAPTYDQEALQLLAKYLRILSLTFFFSIDILFLGRVLDGLKKFGLNQIVGMLYSLITIVVIVLFHRQLGIMSLVYSVIISVILQSVVLFIMIFRRRDLYIFKFEFKNPYILKLYSLLFPVFLGTGTLYIGQAIDRIIASSLSVGSVSSLTYAGTLHSVINTLFIASLITVFYTELSQKYAKKDTLNVAATWRKGVATLLLVLVPLVLVFFFNSADIVTIVLKRGAFDDDSVKLTAFALSFYVLGSPFFGIRDLTTRLFYVMKDSKTPMINGVVSIIFNVVLSLILSRVLGIGGITFSASITALFSCLFLIKSLRSNSINLHLQLLIPTVIKVLISGVCMIFILIFLNYVCINLSALSRLSICVCISFSFYMGMLLLLRCHEMIILYRNAMVRLKCKRD